MHELSAVAAIAQRDVTKLLRDRLRLAVSLAFPVMLIAGLGNVLQPTVGRSTRLDEVTVAFTGVLAATLFQSAAAGMISIVEDRENDFARELFVTPVSRLTLVSGKVLGETLVALVQGTFVVVFALAFGVTASLVQLALLIGPAVACCLLGAAFGLATVAALPNQRSAMQVFQFLIIPQYVLGGVLVPLHGMPVALNVLAWAMPLRYGVDLTQAAFYQGKPGYGVVVALNPAWDAAIMAGLFAALMVTGAAVFNYPGAAPVTFECPSAPQRLLFLISDTGGGHRSAALAVADALERAYPGWFVPVLYDPLAGPGAPRWLRNAARLYGPLTRWSPWAWGALFRASDSGLAMAGLRKTIFRSLAGRIRAETDRLQPAALVSFHALMTQPAVMAGRCRRPGLPVVTVVTDLVTVHRAWRCPQADGVVAPSAAVAWRFRRDGANGAHCMQTGLPVGPRFSVGPPGAAERATLRRTLGLSEHAFVVLVTGGAEGSGHIGRQVRGLVGAALRGVEVVAVCGRNRHLERQLRRFGADAGRGSLWVEGFVDNMADWVRCADIVVTKAGPGTLAEAASAGAALIVTSELPGQEHGNTDLVVRAGAARFARRVPDLVREVDQLSRDPARLEAMRAASARLGRPGAAGEVAASLAVLARPLAESNPAVAPELALV